MEQETRRASIKLNEAGALTVNAYLVVMLCVFPLFLTAQYSHARTDKYWFYLTASLVLLAAIIILKLVQKLKVPGEKLSPVLPVSVTDVMMLCFWGFAVISAMLSDHGLKILSGDIARNNGLPLLTLYVIVYFIITREFRYASYVMCAYLGFAMIVAGLTILNFYNIDPLGIYEGYGENTIMDFGSTIGNKNMISSYMCLYLPAAVMSFTVTESRLLRYISAAAICFAYGGLLCADSTSDIFGLVIILPVMMIFSARRLKHLRRYFLAMTILFASGKLLQLFAVIIGDNNKGFEFIQQFLIYSPWGWAPIGIFGALYLIMRFAAKEEKYPAKGVMIGLIVFFGAIGLAALGAMIYFSVYDLETELGSFERLLRFNDAWGTHRGYMWRISLEEYGKLPLINKLFGSGPDTLFYVFEPHFPELYNLFGDSSTDAAHCEYINYLVTHGALGLCAYLGLAGSAIVRGLKSAKKSPYVLIFISAAICYMAQATVNLYSPIVTPLFFIFIALTEAVGRSEELGARS